MDDQPPDEALRDLLARVETAGADAVWIHARKAWLQGLSPRENRDIPPLDYGLVHRVKAEHPHLFLGINGGLHSLPAALAQLGSLDGPMDGVMLGRAAYHDSAMLTGVDGYFPHPVTGAAPAAVDPADFTEAGHRRSPTFWADVREAMMRYAAGHIQAGGRLVHVTRHMVGLFQGWPGARRFRQILSAEATRPGAGPEVIQAAFAAVFLASEQRDAAALSRDAAGLSCDAAE